MPSYRPSNPSWGNVSEMALRGTFHAQNPPIGGKFSAQVWMKGKNHKNSYQLVNELLWQYGDRSGKVIPMMNIHV